LISAAKVNQARTNTDGPTPLYLAANFCRIEIMKILVEAKADFNQSLPAEKNSHP